jgi:DNA-binding NarL/FixJ family response regulator
MIRILIADDHQIVRAGLKQFIAGEIDMQVTAGAASGAEALAAAARGGIDVVLLDVSLPE